MKGSFGSNWLNNALLLTFYGVTRAPRNEELAALYDLLEEMTLAEDKKFSSLSSKWLKKIENWLIISFLITIIVILCFAAWSVIFERSTSSQLLPLSLSLSLS
ncbi:hypothetical protein [Xanthomonas arboricola]|uniref:hypothetical protein n=1 Tax=Xanthomonas arboricola TaxID=56448 RepID=UPI004040BB90